MSTQPPDPYRPPAPPAAPQPEILASGHGSAVPATRRRRSGARRAVAAGVSLVVVAGLGVGGYAAWSALFATGPQPAEALPASTVGYVSLDLDPAGRQKLEARETLGKFPVLDDKIDTDSESSLRSSLFERLQESGACPDVDWEDEVDPWLGDRFAVAAVDLGARDDESPLGVTPVVVVQVTDVDAADAGLEKLLDCATAATEGDDDPYPTDDPAEEPTAYGWSIKDGWAVLAESGDLARAVTEEAEDEPLSDDPDFQRWTGAAGDHGVLTAYASPDAGPLLADAVAEEMGGSSSSCAEASEDGGEPVPCDDSDAGDAGDAMAEGQEVVQRWFEDFEGAGLQVRFADGGLEVETASSTDLLAVSGYGPLAESDGGDDVVATLPDDTAAAVGVGFEPGWFEAVLDSYSSVLGPMADLDELIDQFEEETGLALPEDAEALFGESAAIAVGPRFDTDAEDPSDVDVAVKIQGDPDRITEVLEKLEDNPDVADDLGEVLDHDESGQHVVVGPNAGYREDLLDRGSLGTTDTFEDVVPEAGRAGTVLYVDVDAFDDLLEAEAGGDDELVENLQVLTAVGYSTWTEGDIAHGMLKVTTDD